jgi:hypothetical protein
MVMESIVPIERKSGLLLYVRQIPGPPHTQTRPGGLTDASGIRTSYSRRCEQGNGYTIVAVLEFKKIPVYNIRTLPL